MIAVELRGAVWGCLSWRDVVARRAWMQPRNAAHGPAAGGQPVAGTGGSMAVVPETRRPLSQPRLATLQCLAPLPPRGSGWCVRTTLAQGHLQGAVRQGQVKTPVVWYSMRGLVHAALCAGNRVWAKSEVLARARRRRRRGVRPFVLSWRAFSSLPLGEAAPSKLAATWVTNPRSLPRFAKSETHMDTSVDTRPIAPALHAAAAAMTNEWWTSMACCRTQFPCQRWWHLC